jgi:hypothetical protein
VEGKSFLFLQKKQQTGLRFGGPRAVGAACAGPGCKSFLVLFFEKRTLPAFRQSCRPPPGRMKRAA